MYYILKITCNDNNKIFIAHTKNIKQYMKNNRKFIRNSAKYNNTRHNSMPMLLMTPNISYSILEEVEDENLLLEKRKAHIIKNPTCINVKSWTGN